MTWAHCPHGVRTREKKMASTGANAGHIEVEGKVKFWVGATICRNSVLGQHKTVWILRLRSHQTHTVTEN